LGDFNGLENKKAISRMLFTPLMASDKCRVASGGAGNEDPEQNAYDYDPGWRDAKHF
jgi:hypothetical protein